MGKSKKNKKKRARPEDSGSAGEDQDAGGAVGCGGDEEDKAGRVYQAWLEARYLDFLRALLGWVAEVDDFYRQVMFVLLCLRRQQQQQRQRQHNKKQQER